MQGVVNNMTLKDVTDVSLQLINQYSIAGTPVSSGYNNQQDYLLRIPLLVNDAQNYIATTARKIFAEYVFVQNPTKNLLDGDMYKQRLHTDQDIVFTASVAKAYYFEVSGPASVKVEANGSLVRQIDVTPTTRGFLAYRGITSQAATITITFTGTKPYSIRNIAIYAETYATEAEVPAYVRFNEYTMPDDFFQLCGRGIPVNTDTGFVLSREYKWRGRKTLIVDASATGEWKVDYYRYPTKIEQGTSLTTELDNVPEAQMCIPYYVASHLVYQDDPERSRQLRNEFEVRLSRIQDEIQTEVNPIEDVYGLGGGCY